MTYLKQFYRYVDLSLISNHNGTALNKAYTIGRELYLKRPPDTMLIILIKWFLSTSFYNSDLIERNIDPNLTHDFGLLNPDICFFLRF